MKKADCHVHSEYSKYIGETLWILTWLGVKECFNKLEDIYRVAKERGMDYVPITDHETVEGALILNDKYPDVIVGEEIEIASPLTGLITHWLVYDINEEIHRDIHDLKKIGVKETIEYLKERDIFVCLAHAGHNPSPVQATPEEIGEIVQYADALEIGNALAVTEENILTSLIALFYNKNKIAGSDAHVLDVVGTAFTVVEAAETKQEFLQALKQGRCYINEHRGCNPKELTLTAFDYTKDIYREILFHSRQRERSVFKKYFLDYLKLAVITPAAITCFTTYLYSWNYQRDKKNQALDLTEDFLEFIRGKYRDGKGI